MIDKPGIKFKENPEASRQPALNVVKATVLANGHNIKPIPDTAKVITQTNNTIVSNISLQAISNNPVGDPTRVYLPIDKEVSKSNNFTAKIILNDATAITSEQVIVASEQQITEAIANNTTIELTLDKLMLEQMTPSKLNQEPVADNVTKLIITLDKITIVAHVTSVINEQKIKVSTEKKAAIKLRLGKIAMVSDINNTSTIEAKDVQIRTIPSSITLNFFSQFLPSEQEIIAAKTINPHYFTYNRATAESNSSTPCNRESEVAKFNIVQNFFIYKCSLMIDNLTVAKNEFCDKILHTSLVKDMLNDPALVMQNKVSTDNHLLLNKKANVLSEHIQKYSDFIQNELQIINKIIEQTEEQTEEQAKTQKEIEYDVKMKSELQARITDFKDKFKFLTDTLNNSCKTIELCQAQNYECLLSNWNATKKELTTVVQQKISNANSALTILTDKEIARYVIKQMDIEAFRQKLSLATLTSVKCDKQELLYGYLYELDISILTKFNFYITAMTKIINSASYTTS
jgi:hypothetical protein